MQGGALIIKRPDMRRIPRQNLRKTAQCFFEATPPQQLRTPAHQLLHQLLGIHYRGIIDPLEKTSHFIEKALLKSSEVESPVEAG
jgi:hypothetical protein